MELSIDERARQLLEGFDQLDWHNQSIRYYSIRTPELLASFLAQCNERLRKSILSNCFLHFGFTYRIDLIECFLPYTNFRALFSQDWFYLSFLMEEGAVDVTTFLLDHGVPADLSCSYTDNTTMLFDACENGKVDIVDLLIERGANVNHICSNGSRPIFRALQCNDVRVLDRLIVAGVDLTVTGMYGHGVLSTAICFSLSSFEIIERLVQMRTPLDSYLLVRVALNEQYSVEQRTKIIKLLTDNGYDINL